MSHKPVCVKCHLEFRPARIGVVVVELYTRDQVPYRMINGDVWQCPGCGAEIIVNYGTNSLYHHDEGFEDRLEHIPKSNRVDVCEYIFSPQYKEHSNGEHKN